MTWEKNIENNQGKYKRSGVVSRKKMVQSRQKQKEKKKCKVIIIQSSIKN